MDSPRPTSFFDLPRELREQIYESAMGHIPQEVPINKLSPSLRLPALAFLSLQTLDESLSVYMRHRTLLLDEGSDAAAAPGDAPAGRLTRLLERLPSKANAFAKVRSITISRPQLVFSVPPDWTSRRKTHGTTHSLVSRCPGLRTLSFTVHAGTVLDLGGSGPPRIKAADQIERKFRFRPLVDHPSLRTFRILFVGSELYVEQLKVRPDQIFQVLANMLERWFKDRGKTINIEIVPIFLDAQWFQYGCPVDEKGRDQLQM